MEDRLNQHSEILRAELQHQAERETAALKDRMAIFEQRILNLERKVNFPQHPSGQ